VQLQVLLVLLAVLVQRTLGRQIVGACRLRFAALKPYGRRLLRQPLLLDLQLLIFGVLLALLSQPAGLVFFFFWVLAGWQGLRLLVRLLSGLLPPRPLRDLDSRLIRPLFLVGIVLGLIAQVDSLQDLATLPVGEWFGSEVNLGQLFVALLITYLLLIGSGPPARGMAFVLQRGIGLSEGSRRAMALMIQYVLVGCGILWVLLYVGFNSTAILAVAGGLSVGLGFGVKEVFSNFISGLWLLFEGSVRPGSILYVDGDPCEVRSLGLRAAVLWRNRDNAELVVPNQTFFTDTTTTFTGSDHFRRSEIQVGVAYRHDPAGVQALLEALARSSPRVLEDPPPRAFLLSYGDSAILYSLRFWISDPMENLSICSEIQTAVWQAFKARGIEIPFPQRVLQGTVAIDTPVAGGASPEGGS
jgi:small-conductance mechanosensitive channel